MSVYVPDELWDRVRALHAGEPTSKLVQRGLERLLEGESAGTPSYASPPTWAAYQMVSLRKKLGAEARKEYETGYTAAIEIAGVLPFAVVDRLADLNFDVVRWLKEYREAAADELYSSGQFIRPTEHLSRPDFEQLLRDRDSGKYSRLPDVAAAQSSWSWVWKLASSLGKLADPVGFDEANFTPTKPRLRGFSDAMRALWSAVETPGQTASRRPREIVRRTRGGESRNPTSEITE
jgi:hypothetical protein